MTGGQGLREVLAEHLMREYEQEYTVTEPVSAWYPQADRILALPEVAALIADAERVRRVEALVRDGEAQEAQTAAEGDPLTVMVRVSTLRRALDGEAQT